MPSLLINNKKVKDPEEIAGAFNTFFSNCINTKFASRSER
jgi:hypothetical protein